jgi:hypothetical protein
VAAKNKERFMAEREEPITVGFEIERLHHEKVDLASLFLTYLRQRSLWEQIKAGEVTLDTAKEIDFLMDLQRTADVIEANIGRSPREMEPGECLGYIRPAIILHDLEFSRESQEGTRMRELKTFPATSVRTALYEILSTLNAAELKRCLSVHETLAGVDLTPSHTEIMDYTAMAAAAGFYSYDEVQLDRMRRGSPMVENFAKSSVVDGELFYFPYHKRRCLSELNLEVLKGFFTGAVERRIHGQLREGTWRLFLMDAINSYLVAYGINAAQVPEDRRNPIERRRAEAWFKLMEGWGDFLKKYGFDNPPNEERYVICESILSVKSLKGSTEYEKFVPKLIVKAKDDPEFKRGARELLSEYRRAVRPTIGLGSSRVRPEEVKQQET